jgi:RNAse (barnase) inhibitor barstar
MQPKVLVIDGSHFSTLNGFYDEVEMLLAKGLDWQAGHNLDAFNDLLYGGFGVMEPFEKFTLIWKGSTKSRNDLGKEETIRYYERKLASNQRIKFEMFAEKLEKMKRGEGETLFDVLVEIIQTHPHITLILED